jgi:hypothetical protein
VDGKKRVGEGPGGPGRCMANVAMQATQRTHETGDPSPSSTTHAAMLLLGGKRRWLETYRRRVGQWRPGVEWRRVGAIQGRAWWRLPPSQQLLKASSSPQRGPSEWRRRRPPVNLGGKEMGIRTGEGR